MTKTEGILNKEILSNEEREILGFADLQSEALIVTKGIHILFSLSVLC